MLRAIFLTLISTSAFGQALITDHIPDSTSVNEPDGFVYADDRTHRNAYTFEIRFRIDSTEYDDSQTYSCGGNYGGVPQRYWLYDRYGRDNAGRWLIAVGDGQLCYMDQPRYSWGYRSFNVELPVALDTCHTLTARREASGRLTVTLDGETRTVDEYDGPATYRAWNNGVGIGREVNGYHNWRRWDSFPGEVSYVEDNGRIIDFATDGTVTGAACLDTSACGDTPPPPPPPPPTACEADPDSVDCACKITPHPACFAYLVPYLIWGKA